MLLTCVLLLTSILLLYVKLIKSLKIKLSIRLINSIYNSKLCIPIVNKYDKKYTNICCVKHVIVTTFLKVIYICIKLYKNENISFKKKCIKNKNK